MMSRATIAVLSTENLLHNVEVLKKQAPQTHMIAMIKANAYGHGLRSVARRLQSVVGALGVASIDEALAIRQVGVQSPIVLMEGVFEQDELLLASVQGFAVVLHHEAQIEWLETNQFPVPIRLWIKVDSGMGRLGFSVDQVFSVFKRLEHHPSVRRPIGLLSHLACAEERGNPHNQKQIKLFASIAQKITGLKSLVNSAGIFHFPEAHYDVIRPGLSLYGISPVPEKTAEAFHLKPVMTLQTRLIAVRRLQAGDPIGYGSRFICPEAMLVGIIAIGYGDGYPKTAQQLPVLIRGIRCESIGMVSMDMVALDLRCCPQAQIGDPVILWGQGLPIEEVALAAQRSPYELLTGVQQRVQFHWTMRDQ